MNKKTEEVSSSGSSEANVNNSGNRVLKLGLDVHYRPARTIRTKSSHRVYEPM
ncbi:MAG TPA: hypothetical protein VE860_17335 [Chthoniobacterales bacterium]|nr:hypothetical protein [Chthoniobacterales bacterium]